jgi:hypothetical protein
LLPDLRAAADPGSQIAAFSGIVSMVWPFAGSAVWAVTSAGYSL